MVERDKLEELYNKNILSRDEYLKLLNRVPLQVEQPAKKSILGTIVGVIGAIILSVIAFVVILSGACMLILAGFGDKIL